MEEIVPMVIVSVFLGSIVLFTKILSDNRVKRELISMQADRETIDYLMLQAPAQNLESSLKWGIVSVSLGAAFATIHLMGLSVESPMTYGLLFIFGGAGLLGHYALKSGNED